MAAKNVRMASIQAFNMDKRSPSPSPVRGIAKGSTVVSRENSRTPSPKNEKAKPIVLKKPKANILPKKGKDEKVGKTEKTGKVEKNEEDIADEEERGRAKKKVSKTALKQQTMTQEEINNFVREHTKNHYAVPPKYYNLLAPGDFIRYKDLEGVFYKGGVIRFRGEDEKKGEFLALSPFMPTGPKFVQTFRVYLNECKTIWKKITIDVEMLKNAIDKKSAIINDLSEFLYEKYKDEFVEFLFKRQEARRQAENS